MNITTILEIEKLESKIEILSDELQTYKEKMKKIEDDLKSHPMFITLNQNREAISKCLVINKRLTFPNGESMSIQCSESHYCDYSIDTKTEDVLSYPNYEIGFPSPLLKGRGLLQMCEGEDVVGYISKAILLKIWELNQ